MKTTDLRIGNKVAVNGFEMEVVALFTDTVYLDFKGNEGGVWEEKIEDIEAIPITKELLLSLGAVDISKDFPRFNLKGIQINYVNGMWIEYVSRVEITGLHHLQNIFYFRMTEELIK